MSAEKWIHGTKDILAEIERLIPERRWSTSSIRYYASLSGTKHLPVKRMMGQTSIRQRDLEAWARARQADDTCG